MWCVVFCVCACGVCGVWVVCVHVVLCRRACCVYMWCCVGVGDVLCGCCVLCGWCGVWVLCVVCFCVFVLFCFFFSQFSSFSFLLSLLSSFPLLSSLFCLLFLFLFSSISFTPTNTVQSTDQQNWRSTSRRLNVIWRTAGVHSSRLSALLSTPSSLLSLSSSSKKGGNFLLQEYFWRGIYFYYSLKLIPKNRRRGKLQSLQFYINSKTIGL